MNALYLWLAANAINVAALAVLIGVFRYRRRRATEQPHPDAPAAPPWVREQRALNAQSALAEMVFYGGLLLLGVGMIVAALNWDRWFGGAVPWIIPGGTVLFAAIYLGKATWRVHEIRRREEIANHAEREAGESYRSGYVAGGGDDAEARRLAAIEDATRGGYG